MRRGWWLFVACYGASGTAALIYEVAWTRLFTLELGHTVAASSTVLAAFMGGLALGAWLAGRYPPLGERRLQTYAALEIVVALLAIALPAILLNFRPVLAWAYADGLAPARFAFVRVALSLALLGPRRRGCDLPIAPRGSQTSGSADAGPVPPPWTPVFVCGQFGGAALAPSAPVLLLQQWVFGNHVDKSAQRRSD
jgi:spermidine synthase